jgi:hypothetical protein
VYHAAVALEGGRRIRAEVDGVLADVPPAVRAMRMKLVTLLMVHAIADRRARVSAGHHDGLTEDEFDDELFAAMAAVLCPVAVTATSR